MKAAITSPTYCLPEQALTNQDLAERFPEIRIDDLTRLTGVHERHVCGANETGSDLAVKAAEELFETTPIEKSKIDFLIYCTSIGDYLTPPTSCILQDRLGLRKNIGTYDYNQGCTGYIYGLSQAKGLIETGQASHVLLLTAETITKKIHPADKSNRAIFGDGATATLISDETNDGAVIGDFVFGTDGGGYSNIIIQHGGAVYPYPQTHSEDYRDAFGNVRNDGCFYMNGSEVFTFSVSHVPPMVKQILGKNGTSQEKISLFIFHQANQIILETIFKKLKTRKDQEFYCLEKWGNTVQSTIPIALNEAMKQGKIQKGDQVLVAGFGVGFSWAGTVLQF